MHFAAVELFETADQQRCWRTSVIKRQQGEEVRKNDRQGPSRAEIARRPRVGRGAIGRCADMEDLSLRCPGDLWYGSRIDKFVAVVDARLAEGAHSDQPPSKLVAFSFSVK